MTAPLKTIESPDGIAGQSLGAAPCSASLDVADCCISLDEARDVIRRRERYADEVMAWMDERRNATDFTTFGMIQERLRPLCSKPNGKAQAPPTRNQKTPHTMPTESKPETNEVQTTQAVDPVANCSALEWENIARWLYAILDDIDTASDHAKGDDVKYRECVERLQRLRGEVGASFDGQTLTWRNPPEEYGLTRLWHPCTLTPWPNAVITHGSERSGETLGA